MNKIAAKIFITTMAFLLCMETYAKSPFSISNISFSKEVNQHVKPNEYVDITFGYTSNGKEVQIKAMPMYRGQALKNSSLIPSGVLKDTSGKAKCSFTLQTIGDVDQIRFRIIETRTSLMLYEYVYQRDIEFSHSASMAEVSLDIEKYNANTIYTYGTVINKATKPLSKLMIELPFEKAEIIKIAGINKKESDNELILYSDLWRTPLEPGAIKQFIMEIAIEEGFSMPKKGKFNGTEIELILTGDTLTLPEEVEHSVDMIVLSEWDKGCIVEFNVKHQKPHTLVAPIGHHLEGLDHWGINDLLHEEKNITFQGIKNQFGFIAEKKQEELIMPEKVTLNSKEVPLMTINKSKTKTHPSKPIVRNAVLAFNLVHDGHAKVSIWDKEGTHIETVFEEETTAGFHSLRWTPKALDEVVYYYKIESHGSSLIGKILH